MLTANRLAAGLDEDFFPSVDSDRLAVIESTYLRHPNLSLSCLFEPGRLLYVQQRQQAGIACLLAVDENGTVAGSLLPRSENRIGEAIRTGRQIFAVVKEDAESDIFVDIVGDV